MQLVLSNNRVIAHGKNFFAMGGVVINTETGAKYENATIAECDNCPSDIGEVGYEYYAGVFVPCAPYGKGNGNVAVLCDRDCKALKDSGIPLDSVGRIKKLTYKGTGSGALYLAFSGVPQIVFIRQIIESNPYNEDMEYGIVMNGLLYGTKLNNSDYDHFFDTLPDVFPLSDSPSVADDAQGEGGYILSLEYSDYFNTDGVEYEAIAIVKGEE